MVGPLADLPVAHLEEMAVLEVLSVVKEDQREALLVDLLVGQPEGL